MQIFILSKTTEDIISYNDYLSTLNLWVAVIAVIVAIAFGYNIYSTYKSKKDVENALIEYKDKFEKQEKNMSTVLQEFENKKLYNNQLTLAIANMRTGADYPEKFLTEYPDDLLANQIYGHSIFHQYDSYTSKDKKEYIKTNLDNIRKALKCYIYIADNGYHDKIRHYGLGGVFYDNIVHEICMLANFIIDSDVYIKEDVFLLKSCFNAILHSLNYNESDLLYLGPSNVFLLNYYGLFYKYGLYLLKHKIDMAIPHLEKFVKLANRNELLKEDVQKAKIIISNDNTNNI
ncbi:MAG: hypothetical protein RSE56_03235 [Bacilli bacterium]